jgi:hypothetical protein
MQVTEMPSNPPLISLFTAVDPVFSALSHSDQSKKPAASRSGFVIQ